MGIKYIWFERIEEIHIYDHSQRLRLSGRGAERSTNDCQFKSHDGQVSTWSALVIEMHITPPTNLVTSEHAFPNLLYQLNLTTLIPVAHDKPWPDTFAVCPKVPPLEMTTTEITSQETPDPWMIKYNGTYILTFTTGNRVELWRSALLHDFHDNVAAKRVIWCPPRNIVQIVDVKAPGGRKYTNVGYLGSGTTYRRRLLVGLFLWCESRSRKSVT